VDIEQTVFTIISHSGEARSLFMKAIKHAKEGAFEDAQQCMEEAEEKLEKAHQKQSELIQLEAGGKKIAPTILLIHGQDHLMTVMMLKDITEEFIDMYSHMQIKPLK